MSGLEIIRDECRRYVPRGVSALASDVALPISTLQDFIDAGKKLPADAIERLVLRLFHGTTLYNSREDRLVKAPDRATPLAPNYPREPPPRVKANQPPPLFPRAERQKEPNHGAPPYVPPWLRKKA